MTDTVQARLRRHALPKRGTVVGDYLEDTADRIDALEAAIEAAMEAIAPARGAEGRRGDD